MLKYFIFNVKLADTTIIKLLIGSFPKKFRMVLSVCSNNGGQGDSRRQAIAGRPTILLKNKLPYC